MSIPGNYPATFRLGEGADGHEEAAPPSHSTPLKILLVEDDPSFGALMEAILSEGDYGHFATTRAIYLAQALDLLKEIPSDLVLLDLSLPDSSGIATLTRLHHAYPRVPIVVLTGTRDENLAIEALRSGAQDYIVKGQADNEVLVRSVRYAVERHRVEHDLLESESRYRALLEQASDGIFVLDKNNRMVEVNGIGTELLGYTQEELLHLNSQDLLLPIDAVIDPDRTDDFFSGKIIVVERPVRRKDGTDITLEISARRLEDERTLAIARDVTQRRVAAEALQARADEQTNLLHQLLNAQEDERRRLSMDIHDGPLQSLGVCLLALDRSMRRIDRGEVEAGRRELDGLRSSIASTVSEVRAVLADLSLELLTQYGLETALRNHIERFSEVTGIDVELKYSVRSKLGADVTLLMYRLAQEALANIRKHSRAEKAFLHVRSSRGKLSMTIRDTGRGFDPQAVLQKRYVGAQLGLRSMRERIELAGGTFTIMSAEGKGTVLEFSCPLPGKK